MDIVQTFYDNMATQYEKLFADWHETTVQQAEFLDGLFKRYGHQKTTRVLDCACGIGTQTIGLARLGYNVTASDISIRELREAEGRAAKEHLPVSFHQADFCQLENTFSRLFDIVIAMDNALPHMLTSHMLHKAVKSMIGRLTPGGIFVASIRDYDRLLTDKPLYSPPYIHSTPEGQRVSFQTWHWEGERYKLIQYIIDDQSQLEISKFTCEYRATRRSELTHLFLSNGCSEVQWLFPEDTGFYQPIVVARK